MKLKKSSLITLSTLIALIVSSLFIAVSLNAVAPVNQLSPISLASPASRVTVIDKTATSAAPAEDGLLFVRLTTNENPNYPFANPERAVFPIANKSITIRMLDNLSAPPLTISTNRRGIAVAVLPLGAYSVALNVQIIQVYVQVQIYRHNITRLSVRVRADVYHPSFSEVSDASFPGNGNLENIFAFIHSSSPIAKVGDTIQLWVEHGVGVVSISNATIASEQPEGDGLWLRVQSHDTAATQTASSLVLVAYSYSYSLNVGPFRFPQS